MIAVISRIISNFRRFKSQNFYQILPSFCNYHKPYHDGNRLSLIHPNKYKTWALLPGNLEAFLYSQLSKSTHNILYNNGILLNNLLIPKLLSNSLFYSSLINLDFLLPYTIHFDDSIVLVFLVFSTFLPSFSEFFLQFKK